MLKGHWLQSNQTVAGKFIENSSERENERQWHHCSTKLHYVQTWNCISFVICERAFYWPCIAQTCKHCHFDGVTERQNTTWLYTNRKGKRVRSRIRIQLIFESRSLCFACWILWSFLSFRMMSIVLFLILTASSEVIVIGFGLLDVLQCSVHYFFVVLIFLLFSDVHQHNATANSEIENCSSRTLLPSLSLPTCVWRIVIVVWT